MASKKALSKQSLLKGGANHMSLCYRSHCVVFDLETVYKAVHKAVYGTVLIWTEILSKIVRFVMRYARKVSMHHFYI